MPRPGDAERVNGAFPLLGIGVHHVRPYHGQSKPIERAFGTVCDRFSRWFDTYCGNKTQNKPESLQANMEAGKALTLEEFTAAFAEWLEHDYHARPHAGDAMDGMSPAEAWERHLRAKRTVSREMLAFVTLPRFGPVKIGRHGVTYKGLHFGATDAEIQRRFGQTVMLVIDNADLSAVLVLDQADKLICRARANVKLPFIADSQALREAIADQKQARRTLRQYVEQRPRMADSTAGFLSRRVAQKAIGPRPSPGAPPAPVQPHRTGFEDQLPAIQKAIGREPVAVGAESFSFDRLSGALERMAAHQDGEADGEDNFMKLTRLYGEDGDE